MPELADVEGFRRLLGDRVVRRRIVEMEVRDRSVLRNTTAPRLRDALVGRTFRQPDRHGKWLLARTTGPLVLLHFGMSGSLEWVERDVDYHPHDRVAFIVGPGELRYRDQRKLQGLWLADDDAAAAKVTGPLGPDALGIGHAELRHQLEGRRANLKAVLMDQSAVAGLGNLLTDEILWQARLWPSRPPASLDAQD